MELQQKILEAAVTELQKQLVECQKDRDALQEKCNVFADKTIAMRQQLSECEKECEKQIKECNEFWGKKFDVDYWEIILKEEYK